MTHSRSTQNYYTAGLDPNILHPDVIVDTDNRSDCTSTTSQKKRRKLSTSTDGDSTNYELIEYLKRREKRDEELLKRMDAREERFMNLLERTVVAIETLAAGRLLPSSTSTPSPPPPPLRTRPAHALVPVPIVTLKEPAFTTPEEAPSTVVLPESPAKCAEQPASGETIESSESAIVEIPDDADEGESPTIELASATPGSEKDDEERHT